MPRLRRCFGLLLLPMLISLLPARGVVAQQASGISIGDPRAPIVQRADLYCAGFISSKQITPEFFIVGGERESEQNWYTTTNVIYLNYGAKHGASVGETLYVIREKGKYENPFTGKNLGRYFEEVGMVRILAVQRNVSTARVEVSCMPLRFGDFVRAYSGYVGPTAREYQPLNRYDLPSGKLSGQIVLAREHRNHLAERDIVYLDIGDNSGVKLGQYYTVFRSLSKHEGVVDWHSEDNEILEYDDEAFHRTKEFRDERYRGSDFSILRGTKESDDVVENRKGLPRKVVGEAVVIRVEEKSATAVITRVTQEVNIGDYVELQ
jgi:hypothetical protein